ncbi:MAG: methyltransferase domain-containing protein [Gallionella sp.]|nr:methyltransferase domain-containing protein [Gallionella sp.]MDD4958244.1 methyltransferase domain-containing protein [Gallionella sp.]
MKLTLISAICPVCNHSVAAPFFDGGAQPLATLGWPDTAAAAQAMPRHPQDFVQCPNCTHVWNRSFSYDAIPYENNPNRMYNAGSIWKGHLAATRDVLLGNLPPQPTVVEIGCGEGHFLRGLGEACEGGRFAGFDPNASTETGRGVEFHARYFHPLTDVPDFAPDAIVIRHVLEHLLDPAVLLEQLAWGAAMQDKPCYLFAEVPCIDRVFETNRLADFFYEHTSHFTTTSFRALMERAGEVVALSHGYDGEVVYALVQLHVPDALRNRAQVANQFADRAEVSRTTIRGQLDTLAAAGQRVAIWGGTGKAAAFIHQFGADAVRFPLVVDSDPDKAGTFVPGTGQEIVFRDALKSQPVDVVIIPTQWRAKDIVAEMAREGIVAQVLIEHQGHLIDFALDTHPYHG